MGLPHFEVASGSIDGSNTTFFTSLPYQPGFTAVWLNGQLKRRDFADGWTETAPATGQFDMDQAPQVGDVVQVFFLEAEGISTNVCQEVSPLNGTINEVDTLVGSLIASCGTEMYGVLDTSVVADELVGMLEEACSTTLFGVLNEVDAEALSGVIVVCDD